ncbi:hypothetical protein [Xylanibacter caecicola]|uniref:hypothetical protein n=1 Tax=Xylanibacter caecicola TaxID=2736294 RepID=UPI00258ABB6A|nr:hypothetical protein [Xylanibacter caecicola]
MKKILLFLSLALAIQASVNAQNDEENISYVSDGTVIQNFGLPLVRTSKGATKIIPVFEGNWNNEMKGAFKYACKIWEEAMPTTFPIKIRAIMDTNNPMYKDKNVLSSVIHHEPFSHI